MTFPRTLRPESDHTFETFYITHAREMYWVGVAVCGDSFLAEEVVQEVFMQLWEQRVDPSSIRNPHSYLATLVKNRIYDVIRHRSVVRAHEERVRYELEVADLEDLTDEEREEMISKAWRLVQSLPEAAREIFLLATMEGLKYSEIAERKGISINTVKTQLRIARKKLRSDPLAMIGLWIILTHLS